MILCDPSTKGWPLVRIKIPFITLQESLSVADIVLWAALYPVLSGSSTLLGKCKNLLYLQKVFSF